MCDFLAICHQVLDLLYFQNNGDIKLVQLRHLFFLEVFNLLLSFSELRVDALLLVFHAFALLLLLVDVETDLLF